MTSREKYLSSSKLIAVKGRNGSKQKLTWKKGNDFGLREKKFLSLLICHLILKLVSNFSPRCLIK